LVTLKEEQHSCKEETFDELYRSLSTSLRNFIFFKCGDEARSGDITQEAFIKLWEHCKKVPPAKAKSFLFTVANNLFLNSVAHQKVVFTYKNTKRTQINEQSPQYMLEEKEFGQRLANAIEQLTEVQRTAFLLSRVEGKKYKEIALILGISEKAAGKRIHDALETLRLSIENI
jgi:RNA polymerase sigma-70 factor (ECF subfamily)